MRLRYTLRGAAELDNVLTDLAHKSPLGARHVQMRIQEIVLSCCAIPTPVNSPAKAG